MFPAYIYIALRALLAVDVRPALASMKEPPLGLLGHDFNKQHGTSYSEGA